MLCKVIKVEGTVATELLLTLGFMQTRNTKVKLVDLRVRIRSDNMRRPPGGVQTALSSWRMHKHSDTRHPL